MGDGHLAGAPQVDERRIPMHRATVIPAGPGQRPLEHQIHMLGMVGGHLHGTPRVRRPIRMSMVDPGPAERERGMRARGHQIRMLGVGGGRRDLVARAPVRRMVGGEAQRPSLAVLVLVTAGGEVRRQELVLARTVAGGVVMLRLRETIGVVVQQMIG